MFDRDKMVDWLTDDAVNSAQSRNDLRWYVREYFNRLSNGNLQQEYNDAGGPGCPNDDQGRHSPDEHGQCDDCREVL